VLASSLDDVARPAGDPTGTRVAMARWNSNVVVVVDVGSGARENVTIDVPSDQCSLVSWYDAANVLLLCTDGSTDLGVDASNHPRLYLLDVDAGRTVLQRDLSDGSPIPAAGGAWVRDGLVAVTVRDDYLCSSAAMLWDGDEFTMLQPRAYPASTMSVAAGGGQVYVSEIASCSGLVLETVTVHDLSTGVSIPLAPLPSREPPGGRWEEISHSLVVGGAS
jgi:hypothetical protein